MIKLKTIRGHCHDIDLRVNKWLKENFGKINIESKDVQCARNSRDEMWYSVSIWYTERIVLDELKLSLPEPMREQKLDRGFDENGSFYSQHMGR